MDKRSRARMNVILSMLIFGTIGLFARSIPLPSALVALIRGLIGAPFLLLVMLLRKERPALRDIKRNLPLLCASGLLLGFNWILLFEAYRFTTVANATLGYYTAPIIIVAVSPVILRERMTVKKLLCVLAALLGMVFVSGAAENGIPSLAEARGLLLALGAAVFYAAIVMLNKKLKNISAFDRTLVQIAVSALALLPYNLIAGNFQGISINGFSALMLLILGVVHTGLAFYLYFGSMEELPAQTLAILSYIDPVTALILSALLLREEMSIYGLLGAALVLGAALISELPEKRKK